MSFLLARRVLVGATGFFSPKSQVELAGSWG